MRFPISIDIVTNHLRCIDSMYRNWWSPQFCTPFNVGFCRTMLNENLLFWAVVPCVGGVATTTRPLLSRVQLSVSTYKDWEESRPVFQREADFVVPDGLWPVAMIVLYWKGVFFCIISRFNFFSISMKIIVIWNRALEVSLIE